MEEIIRNSEILSAVKWYFEFKNLSLKNALSLRCPLSVENQKDLRQYYSQYFSGLLSATELLLENEYANHLAFKKALEMKLSFEGNPDGEKNYLYLRELRNSIIHRGLDISSSAHVNGDFLLLISPSPVTNRKGNVSHEPFGYYLIEIIEKCESVIGYIVLDHFEEFELLKDCLSKDKFINQGEQFILSSTAMPEWAKKLALGAIKDIDHEEAHLVFIKGLIETLKTNVLSQHTV